MSTRRLLASLSLAPVFALGVSAVHAADHLDAPAVADNGQTDINDLYAFQSPTNADNTVLILTVNPLVGLPRPDFTFGGPPSPDTFSTSALYDFQIDNDGDAVPDVTYTTQFSMGPGGLQTLNTTRTAGGTSADYATGLTERNLSTAGGGQIRAGLFEDPFFFDLPGFLALDFTGTDTFAGTDVTAIVLELPSSELGADNVGIFATTRDADGNRIDRVGRPGINTVLIPSGSKDAFNQGDPVNDPANFTDEVVSKINDLPGDADADAIAGVLLPDLLTYDASSSEGFLNGRKLTDDVIDIELNLLTAGAVTGDGVDSNDAPFLDIFPYLAAPNGQPNVIPTPAALPAGLALLGLVTLRRRRRA